MATKTVTFKGIYEIQINVYHNETGEATKVSAIYGLVDTDEKRYPKQMADFNQPDFTEPQWLKVTHFVNLIENKVLAKEGL